MGEKPRFVANVIIFGANETRWSFPDVLSEPHRESSWTARYEMKRLTQTDCYRLAECAEALRYLLGDCPTTELACQKIRDLRRAYREREVLDEGGGE